MCTFDYMGAAEFENGALPTAFETLFNAKDLEAYTFNVSGNPELPWYSSKMQKFDCALRDKIKEDNVLSATVFVIAPKKIRPHVDQVIRLIADGYEDFLKEPTYLRETLFSSWRWSDYEEDEWIYHAKQGWIELDNGFMFFASEDMWRDFCKLFDHEPSFDIEVLRPDFSCIDQVLESYKT